MFPRGRPPSFAVSRLACLGLLAVAGCSQNPYLAGTAGGTWNVPQTASVRQDEARIAELNRRVQLLDDNNRQLHTQLAQVEQQSRVYRDEAALLRSQLADVSGQLESTQIAARQAESQVQGMRASAQIRGGATIRPNTNLTQAAQGLNLAGLQIENDGSALRILVPADQLFSPGTATMHAQAVATLDPIAAQLKRAFPRNRIGIEGYTDASPVYGGAVANPHQLTSAQASAVLEVLTRRGGLPPTQLFTVAQGSNNPRASNHTAAGRSANRRIELVVYPQDYQ